MIQASVLKKIMLIGYGAMAREVVERLPAGVTLGWVVVPASMRDEVTRELAWNDVAVMDDVSTIEAAPDLVLECAGHGALMQHGCTVLERGWPLAVASVGALVDDALHQRLRDSARKGGTTLRILSGAVAGLDGLAAAREAGLDEVVYISRKSPQSWRGSPAETMVDLDAVTEATVFFEGSAGEAARLFPANVNVAATIALRGVGLEATRVQLMVDPDTRRNTHRIHARGAFGNMTVELSGHPLANNPRTSMLAALSAVSACRDLLEPGA